MPLGAAAGRGGDGGPTIPLPGWRDWLFSARSFAAAMLALWLALWLDLPRPYWAVGTVYIVIQPLSGALRAKALARFAGTFAGAAFSVAAVPNLVDAPPLLALVLAGWVACCTMGSLYDPTPRSYAFRLAGFTAALIAFPSVDAPGAIFDTALARVEEIGLGILCATLVDQVFPRPSAPLLLARVEAWRASMARFGAEALAGRLDEARFVADRRQVARDGAALDTMFEEARYEAAAERAGLAWVQALRARARAVPALISAVADRAQGLRRDAPAAQAAIAPSAQAAITSPAAQAAIAPPAQVAIAPLLEAAGAWLAETADPARRPAALAAAPDLLARLRSAEREAAAAAGDWPTLLREGLLARLRELVETWARALALEPRPGAHAPPPRLAAAPVTSGQMDPLLVGLTGLSVLLAVLACDIAWVATAWPEGGTATMMAAVSTAMFAQLDDPAPAIANFLTMTGIAAVVGALYLFAALPAIDGFPLLAFALGLVYLPMGALHAQPATIGTALPLLVNTVALMSLQETYAAEFASYVNGAVALLIGFAAGLVSTRLVRAFGVDWRLRRLVAADRRDLARLVEGRQADLRRSVAAMLDRFEYLAGRIGSADATTLEVSELAELRAAINVQRLREVAPQLPPALRGGIEATLAAVAAWARGRATPETVAARLDAALGLAMPVRDRAARQAALALSGLRRALLPTAPPPAPTHPAPALEQAA
ncbi:FUSC family protein [Paracraurococcus lichenis]|uniref:FUSC family protein n=1 Tax=Paracraurococcus lichenis TaxID=3064888 RepID=A0ABT9E689_9PROT|nr:FUSC family protein [Paracraurococcus sp. LOR1-02]MDO9711678.1 FUSC family protein [Paracraurococcus sp. LOR1-02]